MVRRFRLEFGVLALVLSVAWTAHAAEHDAVISGVVRDRQGVPQMGAVVQILSADAIVRATAYTDLQGRYAVARLLPGSYGVRASAALFLPVLRSNLHLQPGHRSVVNLTLSALFDESAWLPAHPRGRDELRDDWDWTLRTSAGRPILKLADDGASARTRTEASRPHAITHLRARVTSPSDRFGQGSARIELRGEQVQADDAGLAIEVSASPNVRTDGTSADASEVSLVYNRPLGIGGEIGGRVSYVSHPEIAFAAAPLALKVMSVSSAERFAIGDFAEVEAGNRVQTMTGPATVTVMRPFLQVSIHPSASWLLMYNVATSPDTQDYDAATASDGDLPVVGYVSGRARVDGGLHQKITLAHKENGTMVSLAYYADALDEVALAGGMAGHGLAPQVTSFAGLLPGALLDSSNGTFEALGQGYDASGVHLVLTQRVRDGAWFALQYSTGKALGRSDTTASSPGSLPRLATRRAQEATVSMRASVARTGTKARVAYRWQPGILVTAIDPYDAPAAGEYLSLHVRQPLNLPGILPEGMELTIDASNLLRQGYRQFERGLPMYLASSPESLQAGLAFSF